MDWRQGSFPEKKILIVMERESGTLQDGKNKSKLPDGVEGKRHLIKKQGNEMIGLEQRLRPILVGKMMEFIVAPLIMDEFVGADENLQQDGGCTEYNGQYKPQIMIPGLCLLIIQTVEKAIDERHSKRSNKHYHLEGPVGYMNV